MLGQIFSTFWVDFHIDIRWKLCNHKIPKQKKKQNVDLIWTYLSLLGLGMAISRRISFLEESRSRGIEESRNDKFIFLGDWGIWNLFLGDRGIWNLFLGVLGEFRGMSHPKNPKIPLKFEKNLKKKIQKKIFSIEFVLQSSECSVIIPKINRFS